MRNTKAERWVYPAGGGREIYRIMEVSGNCSLDSLCRAIFRTFDFGDRHDYGIRMDEKYGTSFPYRSDAKSGKCPDRILIDTLLLKNRQRFFLHYDLKDDWIFTVVVQSIAGNSEQIAPVVIREKGP